MLWPAMLASRVLSKSERARSVCDPGPPVIDENSSGASCPSPEGRLQSHRTAGFAWLNDIPSSHQQAIRRIDLPTQPSSRPNCYTTPAKTGYRVTASALVHA